MIVRGMNGNAASQTIMSDSTDIQVPINPTPHLPLTVFHGGDLDRVRRVYAQLRELSQPLPWWRFIAKRRRKASRTKTMNLLGDCIAAAIQSNPVG